MVPLLLPNEIAVRQPIERESPLEIMHVYCNTTLAELTLALSKALQAGADATAGASREVLRAAQPSRPSPLLADSILPKDPDQ